MTTLLDVNVLLALAWPTHQHHQAAHRWFHRDAHRGWATCGLTQLAFVRLSSNAAFTPDAVLPPTAAALLGRLVDHRAHRYWRELPPVTAHDLRHAVGHQQVTDAYLVALARAHNGRVATFDTRLPAHAVAPTEVLVLQTGV